MDSMHIGRDKRETISIVRVLEREMGIDLEKKTIQMLTSCFPHELRFKYSCNLARTPFVRFFAYSESQLAGHLAVHQINVCMEKRIEKWFGISEVCVYELYRKRGIAKKLLLEVDLLAKHTLSEGRILLFGESRIYRSSGYHPLGCSLLVKDAQQQEKLLRNHSGLIKSLHGGEITADVVNILGEVF